MNQRPLLATIVYTLFALLAFAGNSVLCRLALGEQSIDAGSFTVIRLFSGIIVLSMLWYLTQATQTKPGSITGRGSWSAALMLFIYALGFSYAYISLDTGTGALILFGAVQITMILVSLWRGARLLWVEWLGLGLAFSGFVYLLKPAINTPSLWGFILMMAAGIAWGIYTLIGRGSVNPLADTHFNFLRTLPLIILTLIITLALGDSVLSFNGVMLAVLSGAVASGIGYAVWYRALSGLSAVQAAVLQLLVPVIAAAGGVVFTDEIISVRLLLAALLVLGGILLVVVGRYYMLVRQSQPD
ncbi:DMT family transporter [uncultured Amphritea sp.]|uniref:DMT family transporter n=1 Tax=uncultured Amphritea sp. TaxID=981605 RepID=UPI001D9B3F89|nr:DMT family transporter [uncultured Amphritea sp.]MBR9868674.1 DMT family transporter [Oceanospirillales bacterium]MBR9889756.1 DMT family transporter [Oceanospirillales bacterium]